MDDYTKKCNFKILMLGDCGVGKTSLLQRFLENRYTGDQEATLGLNFQTHTHRIAGHMIDLQLWDTAGEERFSSLGASYYRGAHGIILVYDITKRQSFCNLDNWLQDIQRYAAENVNLVIVGNKCDASGQRQVSQESAATWASLLEILFHEASAKDGTNVHEIFTSMAVIIYNRLIAPHKHDLNRELTDVPPDDSVFLNDDNFDPSDTMQRSSCYSYGI